MLTCYVYIEMDNKFSMTIVPHSFDKHFRIEPKP